MNVHMITSVPAFNGFLIASETIEHGINAGFHIRVSPDQCIPIPLHSMRTCSLIH